MQLGEAGESEWLDMSDSREKLVRMGRGHLTLPSTFRTPSQAQYYARNALLSRLESHAPACIQDLRAEYELWRSAGYRRDRLLTLAEEWAHKWNLRVVPGSPAWVAAAVVQSYRRWQLDGDKPLNFQVHTVIASLPNEVSIPIEAWDPSEETEEAFDTRIRRYKQEVKAWSQANGAKPVRKKTPAHFVWLVRWLANGESFAEIARSERREPETVSTPVLELCEFVGLEPRKRNAPGRPKGSKAKN